MLAATAFFPIIFILRNALMKTVKSTCSGGATQSSTESSETCLQRTWKSISNAFDIIDPFTQFGCACVAAGNYLLFGPIHQNYENQHNGCAGGHCNFLIYMAVLLYKPYLVPMFQFVCSYFNLKHDGESWEYDTPLKNSMKACMGLFFWFAFYLTILLFVIPFVVYSIIIFIIMFPMYVTIFLIVTLAVMYIYRVIVSVVPDNEDHYDFFILDSDSSAITYLKIGVITRFLFFLFISFVYCTLMFPRIYFKCGWIYTARSLFVESFSSGTVSLSFAWPYSLSTTNQTILSISLISGISKAIIKTITTSMSPNKDSVDNSQPVQTIDNDSGDHNTK